MAEKVMHKGGCHCGDVQFEVSAPRDMTAVHCNCSICRMAGFEHVFVAAEDMRLLTDWNALALYQFNSGVAKHYFCKRCGIYTHNVTARFPDKCRVNLGCIDDLDTSDFEVVVFDGKNLL